MKKQLLFISLIAPVCGFAAAPSTTCPSSFVEITEQYMKISNSSSCPYGYTSAGETDSCLVSIPSGSCIIYAPSGTSYTDTLGIYEFTEICPFE